MKIRSLLLLSFALVFVTSCSNQKCIDAAQFTGTVKQLNLQAEGGGGSLVVTIESSNINPESNTTNGKDFIFLVSTTGKSQTSLTNSDGEIDFSSFENGTKITIETTKYCGESLNENTYFASTIKVNS
jgi:hypothetical protein